jgi:hypothetical protein
MNTIITLFILWYTSISSVVPYTPSTQPIQQEGVPEVGIAIQHYKKFKPIKKAHFKAPRTRVYIKPRPTAAPVQKPIQSAQISPSNVVSGCGVYTSHGNQYMDYIFTHESTNNPCAMNELGCIGLGQSCPGGSGLESDCPNWRTDVECQVRHFTAYANKYGGWAGSYAFWIANHYW